MIKNYSLLQAFAESLLQDFLPSLLQATFEASLLQQATFWSWLLQQLVLAQSDAVPAHEGKVNDIVA